MNDNAIKLQIQHLLEKADENALKIVHRYLEESVNYNPSSYALDQEQNEEIERRINELETGSGKNYSIEEAFRIIDDKLKK
jgi:putative addiction module component (TIGR02574 family)